MRPDSAAVKSYIKGLSPWRERTCALLLVPGSVLAVLLWKVPATDPITVSALLVDRVLQALTLFVLPVAVLLLIGGPWWLARVAAVAGMIVSVVLGASTSLAAATQPPLVSGRKILAYATLLAGVILLVVVLREKLSSAQWTVSLVALLSLLPVVQFWASTSFVPEHLNTSVGSTAQIIGQKVEGGGAHGVVDINVYNNGDVQALILASESIICFRSEPTDWVEVDQLYKDDACRIDKFFDNLSVLDSHSSWKVRKVFDRPPLPGPEHAIKVVQVVVLLWYARLDRLRVNADSKNDIKLEPPCKQDSTLTEYEVTPESRYKGVVQTPWRLLYLTPPDSPNGNGDSYFALSTKDEPLCEGEGPNKGLPKSSKYDIAGYVGQNSSRLNYDDWLADLQKR